MLLLETVRVPLSFNVSVDLHHIALLIGVKLFEPLFQTQKQLIIIISILSTILVNLPSTIKIR